MKKIISIVLCIMLSISLVACGKVEKNDEGFLVNLGNALNARWKESNKETPEDEDYKDYIRRLINLETKELGSFEEYDFSDQRLADLAAQYFSALDKQLEGIKHYNVDDTLYYRIFYTEGYNQRAKILYTIYNEYGLSIDEKYTGTLDDFLTLGEKVIAIENLTTQPLLMENKGDEGELIIENTSKFDFSDLCVNINLLDESGIIVNSHPYYIEQWPAGSKYKANVWYSGVDFANVELSFEEYSTSIVSDVVPVEYVDNMIINITPVNLPVESNHGYNEKVYTSCIVNDVRMEISSWYEGKASVSLFFSGTKTFDSDGENSNESCIFVCKVIAEDGSIISSDTVYIDSIKMNETFTNAEAYLDELAPGNYTVVIEDDMD